MALLLLVPLAIGATGIAVTLQACFSDSNDDDMSSDDLSSRYGTYGKKPYSQYRPAPYGGRR
jgi:hypothetical protein